jgi:hypothetical protein
MLPDEYPLFDLFTHANKQTHTHTHTDRRRELVAQAATGTHTQGESKMHREWRRGVGGSGLMGVNPSQSTGKRVCVCMCVYVCDMTSLSVCIDDRPSPLHSLPPTHTYTHTHTRTPSPRHPPHHRSTHACLFQRPSRTFRREKRRPSPPTARQDTPRAAGMCVYVYVCVCVCVCMSTSQKHRYS